jgi:hypothetical protein
MPLFANIDPFARRMLQGALAFAAVMLLMFTVFTVVYMHENPRCAEQVIAQSDSPDGHWVATIMERRCGEAVPIVTHVNLRPAEDSIRSGYFTGLSTEGQVFAVKLGADEAAIRLQWTGNGELTIGCAGCGRNSPDQQETMWKSVRLRYAGAGK